MFVDMRRETLGGWAAIAGALLISLVAWWIVTDYGESADQVAKKTGQKGSGQTMASRVADQEKANVELRKTIDLLKQRTGFALLPKYTVPKGHNQPGEFFVNALGTVREQLKKRAEARSIGRKEDDYDKWIGFGSGRNQPPASAVPKDEAADFLLKMLQLTEKAMDIGLRTPTPLERLLVTHADREQETGPDHMPPLLREYNLTLEVRGSLTDILWILHQLSLYESREGAKDYPLILRSFKVSGENATAIGDIQQLDAVFGIAGMQFIPDSERKGRESTAPQRERGSSQASRGSSGRIQSRP